MNFGWIFSLSFVFYFGSCHLSSDELLLIKFLKSQVDQLAAKFEEVKKENVDLQGRMSDLEKNREVQLKLARGRRQGFPFIAFSAYLDQPLLGLNRGDTIVYNCVLTNDGNAYDNATGVFVAPVSGLYLFSWATTARRLNGQDYYDNWTDLVVDGKHMVSAVAESRQVNEDNQGSNTIVVRVLKGQRVWAVQSSVYQTVHGNPAERSTSFMGVLLYEY